MKVSELLRCKSFSTAKKTQVLDNHDPIDKDLLFYVNIKLLTGSSADDGFFQDLFFVDLAVQKLFLYIVKAEPCNRVCKPFAGDPFIAEE